MFCSNKTLLLVTGDLGWANENEFVSQIALETAPSFSELKLLWKKLSRIFHLCFLLTSNFNLVFTIYFNGKIAACSI